MLRESPRITTAGQVTNYTGTGIQCVGAISGEFTVGDQMHADGARTTPSSTAS